MTTLPTSDVRNVGGSAVARNTTPEWSTAVSVLVRTTPFPSPFLPLAPPLLHSFAGQRSLLFLLLFFVLSSCILRPSRTPNLHPSSSQVKRKGKDKTSRLRSIFNTLTLFTFGWTAHATLVITYKTCHSFMSICLSVASNLRCSNLSLPQAQALLILPAADIIFCAGIVKFKWGEIKQLVYIPFSLRRRIG